jgi:hypothetical protein
VSNKLNFLPSEPARVEQCRASVRNLADSVRERLSDVLLALVGAALGVQAQGQASGQLRQQVACLKLFVLGLDSYLDPTVFQQINLCARELGV